MAMERKAYIASSQCFAKVGGAIQSFNGNLAWYSPTNIHHPQKS